jgi:hypothetical protein
MSDVPSGTATLQMEKTPGTDYRCSTFGPFENHPETSQYLWFEKANEI